MNRAVASLVLVTAGLLLGIRPIPDRAGVALATVAAAPVPEIDPYLRLLSTGTTGTDQDGVAAMTRGLAALRSGNAGVARAAFIEAARLLPSLEDWALLYAASAAASQGLLEDVEAHLGRIDPWLAQERGWQHRVTAMRRSGRTEEALRVTLATAERLGTPERRAAALLEAARIQLALRDTAAAAGTMQRAINEAPTATVATEAARTLLTLPRLSADDHLAIGRLYARHGNTTRALAGLDKYLTSGRGDAGTRGAIRVEAARILFDARLYTEAERRLVTVTREQLPDSIAAEAKLLLGRTLYRLDRTTAARAALQECADRHSLQRAAGEALYILADLDHDSGKLGPARDMYARAAANRPADDPAGDAAMRLGGLLLSAGDAAGASRVFDSYYQAHPEGNRRVQAAFWAGRARLASGDTATALPLLREAHSIDPVSWYGLRAADLLGMGHWTSLLTPAPATGQDGAREADGALRRLDILLQLGLKEAFDFELARQRAQLSGRDGALYAVAEGLHDRGHLLTAVLLGREMRRMEGGWNERILRIVYPFPYRDEIVTQAKRRGLDPFLVAGLIRQESLFNPIAKSSAGAVGLMQVRPPTGRALARREGVRFADTYLNRPELNIRLGTLFFADLLSRYSGRVGFVLAAYNAGPSRLARWRELPEAADPDLFAERIPYRETRDYVKVVQQNARIYQGLYSE
jgi:soluble lytic murein transglycosylase